MSFEKTFSCQFNLNGQRYAASVKVLSTNKESFSDNELIKKIVNDVIQTRQDEIPNRQTSRIGIVLSFEGDEAWGSITEDGKPVFQKKIRSDPLSAQLPSASSLKLIEIADTRFPRRTRTLREIVRSLRSTKHPKTPFVEFIWRIASSIMALFIRIFKPGTIEDMTSVKWHKAPEAKGAMEDAIKEVTDA